jgi:hypothetical protein
LAVLVLAMIAVSRVEIVLGAGVNEIFLRQIDALGGEFSFLDVGCDGVDGFDCFGFVSSRIKTSGCRMQSRSAVLQRNNPVRMGALGTTYGNFDHSNFYTGRYHDLISSVQSRLNSRLQ